MTFDPRQTAPPPARLDLVVLLVRPSKYDDDGYVIRHWRGVLPSNTLNCLHGLTVEAVRSGALAGVHIDVHVMDETVDRVDPRLLARRYLRPGVRGVVALAGVQTNQFPRAQDLARMFKALGFAVMIGGFHVSGAVATSTGMPAECQAMIDAGVTLVLGEVEAHWAGLLRDAAEGRLRPVYNFLGQLPDLTDQAVPEPSPALQRKFAVRGTGTVDMSRGCPFQCSFCTIISVQGRTMRARAPNRVLEQIRANASPTPGRPSVNHYFFTDDNFARNPNWEAVFDGLIELRETGGLEIDFMMQVDIASWRIPRFVEKAARAGCVQVFIGMESIREDNLASVGKRQNRVDGYRAAIARWHEAGVVCHVGYIIGFPHDTYARVMADVRALRDELLVDQASFFIMTPLPGSQDHAAAVAGGARLDPDYNNFDSFHVTQPHPLMSEQEWLRAFKDAWREFYSTEHMAAALLRQNPHTYWGLFKVFVWYRAAMVEGTHPMVTGFFRRKARRQRRPSMPVESRLEYWRARLAEIAATCRGYASIALEMQELWVRTRIRRRDYARWQTLGDFPTRSGTPTRVKLGWSRLHTDLAARLRALGATGHEHVAASSAAFRQRMAALSEAIAPHRSQKPDSGRDQMSRDVVLFEGEPAEAMPCAFQALRHTTRWSLLFGPPSVESRQALTAYWRRTRDAVRHRRLWRINPAALSWGLVREIRNTVVFCAAMITERY